ncbi:MAG TPA: C45 family peptidase, partial [Chloroflexota bacterium]
GTGEVEAPRIVRLEGSPWEMGLAHGQLLGRDIHLLLDELERRVFRRVDPVRSAGIRVLCRVLAAILNRHVPPRLRAELYGIAAGSGADYADILLLNCLDDVLNILRRLAPRAPSLACSSFAIFGQRTFDGSVLHGRNLDYHFRGTPLDDGGAIARMLLAKSILFVHRPRGYAAFASIGWPGLAGVSTAMNEHGIAIGSLTSYVRGTTPNGTPATMIYRRIVEEARKIDETASILRASRRTIGNNLLVSSGQENRPALFEITMSAVEQVLPADGVLVTTNHFASPRLARAQRPYLLPHSVQRCERLRSLCSRDRIHPDEAARFLGDCDCPPGSGPFARVANEGTAVSVLFQPSEVRMWLGSASHPPASHGAFIPLDLTFLLANAQSIRERTA